MATKDVVYIALFAALMAVLAVFPPLMVPAVGVPITAQNLGPLLAGGIVGAKRGGLAMLLFVVLVAVGLPLLSGGRGGLGVFTGPTAGFIFSWPVIAVAVGWLCRRFWNRLNFPAAFLIAGFCSVAIGYGIGIPWLAAVSDLPLATAAAGSAAFIPGDLIKAAVAALVIVAVRRSYPLIASPIAKVRS